MLPSSQKVGRQLFAALVKRGRALRTEHFLLKVYAGAEPAPAKFSVVVSKKIERTAVRRNTVKRRLYAAIHPFLLSAPRGAVGAFFVQKQIHGVQPEKLRREIESAFKNAGIIP